jgi:hypothetical protein
MLQQRFLAGFRPDGRPLACLLTSAFLLATSPLHAQTGDDDETSFFGDKDESPSAENTASTPTSLTVPSLGEIVFGTTALGIPSFGANGLTALGTAALGTPGHFSLTEGSSAASSSATGAAATSAPASDAKSASAAAPPVVPPPPSDDGAGLRTAGYIAGGVGIAGFILFAVAGIGAKNAHDRLEENCGSGQCDEATKQSDIEDGKMLQTAANIGLATGLTGLGLGATLIVLGARPSESSAPSTAANGAMITYAGRF